MTHDFAKIRPEPLLEKKPKQTPPAWSMMITGIVVGMALGVFASVLLYLSGNVPPLANATPPARPAALVASNIEPEAEQQAIEQARPQVELEFYEELRNYEVPIDATPVEIADPNDPLPASYMLQSGAFQDAQRAQNEVERQKSLGLDVSVKVQELTGRRLYLVQSGPYTTRGQLDAAETTLRRNAIKSLRTQVQ